MKNICLIIISILFLLASCTKEYDRETPPLNLDTFFASQVSLTQDSLYVLNLTLQEALTFGITEQEYTKRLNDVAKVNASITKTKEENGILVFSGHPVTKSYGEMYGRVILNDIMYGNTSVIGYYRIMIRVNCTAWLWSAQVSDYGKSISVNFSGLMDVFGVTHEKVVQAPQGGPEVNWNFNVTKAAGDMSTLAVAFHQTNDVPTEN